MGVVQNSPETRVNRYISRLIEARETDTHAHLHYVTLSYKDKKREKGVSVFKCVQMHPEPSFSGTFGHNLVIMNMVIAVFR